MTSKQKAVTRSYQEHILEPRDKTPLEESHEILDHYSDEGILLAAEEVETR